MSQQHKLEELTDALAAIHNVTERAGLGDALRRLENLGNRFFEGREFLVFRVSRQGDLVSEAHGQRLSIPAPRLTGGNALTFVGDEAASLVPQSQRILLLPLHCPEGSLLGGVAFIDLPEDADLSGIESLNTLAALALTRSRVMMDQRLAEAEMSYAWNVVRAFLPESRFEWGEYEMAGLLIPARQVGGDLYDYFPIDQHRFGFLLADATGKGTGPCLQVSTCRAYFRALCRVQENLGEVASQLCALLAEDVRDDKFVTAVFGWLDNRNNSLSFINAGQGAAYFLRGEKLESLPPQDPPLGTFADWNFEVCRRELEEGELVAFFTDGWTERPYGNNDEYGEKRLERSLQGVAGRSARESLRLVYQVFETSCFPEPQKDDVTALLVRRGNRQFLGGNSETREAAK